MKQLSRDDYNALREGATVIEADRYGDKVLLLSDGTYLKLFRVKRLFSSAVFYPYSKRFVKNVSKLVEKGIPTVTVIESYRIPSIRRTAVHYYPLTGKTLRKLGSLDLVTTEKLGKFIRELHDKGIYFRSLHMGNIVISQENRLGLIDVSDMRVLRTSLSNSLRKRNFEHLARYQLDVQAFENQVHFFFKGYLQDSNNIELATFLKKIFYTKRNHAE